MKLCAIYNVWGDIDILEHSVEKIKPLVDGIIIVFSSDSNYGEHIDTSEFDFGFAHPKLVTASPYVVDKNLEPRANETLKRNYGLDLARQHGYTHFVIMDADEFYEPTEFLREKQRMATSDTAGLVCRVKCYFRSPSLTIGYDTTLVPFIHKLTPTIRCEFNRNYPFAWTDTDGEHFTDKKRIRIDPTRSMNVNSGVEWSEITMHHYSWVRHDVRKKIRNSTARANIERSSIVADYINAKEGYFCDFYGKTLERSPNIFGLPDIYDSSLSESVPATGTGSSN